MGRIKEDGRVEAWQKELVRKILNVLIEKDQNTYIHVQSVKNRTNNIQLLVGIVVGMRVRAKNNR